MSSKLVKRDQKISSPIYSQREEFNPIIEDSDEKVPPKLKKVIKFDENSRGVYLLNEFQVFQATQGPVRMSYVSSIHSPFRTCPSEAP